MNTADPISVHELGAYMDRRINATQRAMIIVRNLWHLAECVSILQPPAPPALDDELEEAA